MFNHLNYPKIVNHCINSAMRMVVKQVIQNIALYGLYDSHHLFISFLTRAHGVKMSNKLQKMYPTDMTIVLQYQYDKLVSTEEDLSVTLSFNGYAENITIPYSAIISIEDPSCSFGLHFKNLDTIDGDLHHFTDNHPIFNRENSHSNVFQSEYFDNSMKSVSQKYQPPHSASKNADDIIQSGEKNIRIDLKQTKTKIIDFNRYKEEKSK